MTRVAATLLILAEDALERRFATRGLAEDRRALRALGPEAPPGAPRRRRVEPARRAPENELEARREPVHA